MIAQLAKQAMRDMSEAVILKAFFRDDVCNAQTDRDIKAADNPSPSDQAPSPSSS